MAGFLKRDTYKTPFGEAEIIAASEWVYEYVIVNIITPNKLGEKHNIAKISFCVTRGGSKSADAAVGAAHITRALRRENRGRIAKEVEKAVKVIGTLAIYWANAHPFAFAEARVADARKKLDNAECELRDAELRCSFHGARIPVGADKSAEPLQQPRSLQHSRSRIPVARLGS